MKAKNQQLVSSEIDAKEKLVVYVYEYLIHSGANRAAKVFLEEIRYDKDIHYNDGGPGFLYDWWCVFWDLYCAAPERRVRIEPSNEARAFHDYSMRPILSPSLAQSSPPQPGPPYMGGGPGMMGGPRYAPPGGQLRGSLGPRMQTMGQPHPMGGPPHQHPSMMGAGSPRYAPHPGHPMTPGSSASSGPMIPEPGPSPGMNRMTPNHNSSPRPQMGGPPPNGIGGPLPGPPGGPMVGPPQSMGSAGPPPQQRGGMPPQQWQSNFNVNSPADPQCFMPGPPVSSNQPGDFGGGMMMSDGGMMEVKSAVNNGPPNQQMEEYVMPNTYGQPSDQGEAGPEIMRLKESLENNTKDYNESDQTAFNTLDFVP